MRDRNRSFDPLCDVSEPVLAASPLNNKRENSPSALTPRRVLRSLLPCLHIQRCAGTYFLRSHSPPPENSSPASEEPLLHSALVQVHLKGPSDEEHKKPR